MAWGEIKLEDLKKAGLDPAKLTELEIKLGNVVTKEEIAETKTALQSIQDSLRALTDKVNMAAPVGDKSPEVRNDPPPDPFNIDPIAFMEDPAGNIKRMVQTSVAGVQLHSLNVAADLAYNTAKASLPYFQVFEKEIKEEWDRFTPVQKGQPQQLIENIYNLVKGRHLDEIMTDTNKKEGKYNIIQSGGTTLIQSTTPSKKDEPLSADEQAAMRKFGMNEDEWRASKGGLKYVG
jgi:uncharacterized coiled-coil protein SlyX